jgi:hypothetical protein
MRGKMEDLAKSNDEYGCGSKYIKGKHYIWNQEKPPQDEFCQEVFHYFKEENTNKVTDFSLPEAYVAVHTGFIPVMDGRKKLVRSAH